MQGDLVPALRVSDDYPCAYDKQRDLFIENAEGDSLFGYGPLVKEESYEE